jgi:hypothetical protein
MGKKTTKQDFECPASPRLADEHKHHDDSQHRAGQDNGSRHEGSFENEVDKMIDVLMATDIGL